MNLSMSRQVILTIIISALFVVVLATFSLAYHQGGGQCRLASASEPKIMSEPILPQGPAGASKAVTKSGPSGVGDQVSDCYQTCRVDESQSRFMNSMCWLGCTYSTYGLPAGP